LAARAALARQADFEIAQPAAIRSALRVSNPASPIWKSRGAGGVMMGSGLQRRSDGRAAQDN
jgi:hypothetical protein